VTKSNYPEKYLAELGGEPEVMSPGGSVIISPMGEILAGPLWNKEGLLVAELDLSLLIKSKLDFDVIGHYSRNDIFQFGVNGQPETVRAGKLPDLSDEESIPNEGELVREPKDMDEAEEVELGGEG
jgi:nitrilase